MLNNKKKTTGALCFDNLQLQKGQQKIMLFILFAQKVSQQLDRRDVCLAYDSTPMLTPYIYIAYLKSYVFFTLGIFYQTLFSSKATL